MLVLPTGVAGAAPVGTADSSISPEWAYGAVTTITFSGTSAMGIPYIGNATYGYTVAIAQTNLTGNPHEFELTAQRTMGASFSVKYCYPTCRVVADFAQLSTRLWETVDSVVFLVDNGTVYEANGPVPAFTLLNASTVQVANESESTASSLPSGPGTGPVARSGYVTAQVSAHTSVDFGSGLGLFPTNLSSSQSWNSTAGFHGSVAATYAFQSTHSGPLGSSVQEKNGSIPVEGNGSVALSGSYSSQNSVTLGGINYPEISLSLVGPFTLQDGLLVVPAASDPFQGSHLPWSSNVSGAATATMNFVDVRTLVAGHFGLGASRWLYDATTIEPNAALAPQSTGVTELAGSGTPDAAPATAVQGEPQSATQAQATQACLVSGAGCSSATPGAPLAHGLLGLLGVGAVAATVLIVAVVVVERRRLPPPTYPNAALYPPGANGPAGRTGGPEPTSPPSPAPEEDPLGNLW